MCIIRQLMHHHSIIDSYPKVLLSFDADEIARQKMSMAKLDNGKRHGRCDDSSNDKDYDGESSVASTINSSVVSEPSCGKNKVSQDVMVFEKIAESMPPKSLFHLLRGASQAWGTEQEMANNLLGVEVVVAGAAAAAAGGGAAGYDDDESPTDLNGRRRVRFAKNVNGTVKCTVHKIERINDPALWWQSREFRIIRDDAATIAEHYRRNQRDYSRIVSRLVRYCVKDPSGPREAKLGKFFDCIALHDCVRGLESHIVYEIHQMSPRHVQTVLAAQEKARRYSEFDSDLDSDIESDVESDMESEQAMTVPENTLLRRREESIQRACYYHSKASNRVARCFSQFDTREALKCLCASWHSNVSSSTRPPLKPTRSKDHVNDSECRTESSPCQVSWSPTNADSDDTKAQSVVSY